MRRLTLLVVVVVVGWATTTSLAAAAVWTRTTPQYFYPDLLGVGASSASDVWAVGENDADWSSPVAEHWDGTAWQEMVPGNLADGRNGGLFGVWTGSAWHTVAPAGLANAWVENMTRAPGSTQLWAVGMDMGKGVTNGGPFAAYYH